jgi:hypothetical protein
MPVPDFSPGEVLTAAAMDSIGLWKIANGTLSATTNVNNAFTSDYLNYRIVIATASTSASADIGLRLRVGGADNSTSNYSEAGQRSGFNTTAPTSIGRLNQTGFNIGRVHGTDTIGGIVVDIFNPQSSAVKISWTSQSIDSQFLQNMGGFFNGTTSFDGFTLFGPATWTGTWAVYGYRN